jgi:hypothetical protein
MEDSTPGGFLGSLTRAKPAPSRGTAAVPRETLVGPKLAGAQATRVAEHLAHWRAQRDLLRTAGLPNVPIRTRRSGSTGGRWLALGVRRRAPIGMRRQQCSCLSPAALVPFPPGLLRPRPHRQDEPSPARLAPPARALLAAHGFIRVHRSALVNFARVRELRRSTQARLVPRPRRRRRATRQPPATPGDPAPGRATLFR